MTSTERPVEPREEETPPETQSTPETPADPQQDEALALFESEGGVPHDR